MDTTIPWEWILSVAGGLTVLVAAGGAVLKVLSPYKAIMKRLDRHDELLANDYKKFSDYEAAKAADKAADEAYKTVVLEAIFALLEHARTDNSTGLMDATSKKMQQFLIERK